MYDNAGSPKVKRKQAGVHPDRQQAMTARTETDNHVLPAHGADGDDGFLARLGQRVREARTRRGMTRRILARDSGLSERYIAQLEAGRGNVSIILLRQLGRALPLPLEDLVRDGGEPAVDLRLGTELLARLGPEDLAEARRLLADRFGPPRQDARERRIALIGLRGAGKSTLGRALAAARGLPFVELDAEVERQSGMSLAEMFALYGQSAFRRWERRCLDTLIEAHPGGVVFATGGSIVSEPATFERLLSACHTIWLKAAPEEYMARVVAQGDFRPMADNREAMEDLKRILEARTPLYLKADAVVDTAGRSVDETLAVLEAAAPHQPDPRAR